MKKNKTHPLIVELEQLFRSASDESIAVDQAAYMKNHFPFYGIKKPNRAQLQKECFRKYKLRSEEELRNIIESLWDYEQREMQYAAMDLAIAHHKLWSPQALGFFEALIRKKSWWDSVDAIAANLVGKIILRHPALQSTMDSWIKSDNMWIRRSALIHQLRFKAKTDHERLFSYCTVTMHESDFFIRKAIGWALREHSKTEPELIKSFITRHASSLSALSKKEASKYL